MRPNQPGQLWAQLQKSDGCWEWSGYRFPRGYGRLRINGRVWYAHRLAYTLTYGPIPPGLYVCHHCDNPPCCNPEHLFVGTALDNVRDKEAKGRGGHASTATRRNTGPRGEQHYRAKLTAGQVMGIRQRYAVGGVSHRALAHEFGVSEATIYKLLKGKSWRCVSEDGGPVTSAASTAGL